MKAEQQFMAAMKEAVRTGIKQVDIGRSSGIARQTISGILKNEKPPGTEAQEKIAEACGYSYIDFLIFGRSLLEGTPQQPKKQTAPSKRNNADNNEPHAGYMRIISSVGSFVDKQQEYVDRMHFWIEMFSLLPVPALIAREGFVIYQNEICFKMGDISGRPISKEDVDSGKMVFNGLTYRVNVSYPRWNSMAYMIITLGEIKFDI